MVGVTGLIVSTFCLDRAFGVIIEPINIIEDTE